MAILPYMKQLPRDYALSHYVPPPTPVVVVPEVPVVVAIPPSEGVVDVPILYGGVWVGDIPPAEPSVGWQWMNSSNHYLYLYTDEGCWVQVGTNW